MTDQPTLPIQSEDLSEEFKRIALKKEEASLKQNEAYSKQAEAQAREAKMKLSLHRIEQARRNVEVLSKLIHVGESTDVVTEVLLVNLKIMKETADL